MAESTIVPADTTAFMLLSSTANTLIACAASNRVHDDFSSATRGGNTPETQHNCRWVQARAHHQALKCCAQELHSQGIRDCCIIKHVRKQAQVLLHSGQCLSPRKIGSNLTKLGWSMCLPARKLLGTTGHSRGRRHLCKLLGTTGHSRGRRHFCKLLGTTGHRRGRRHLLIQRPQTLQLCACSKPCRHPCARRKATC